MAITSKQRAHLKKISHNMKPVIQVGKDGVSPALIEQISETIKKRELIKISFLDSMTEDISISTDKILVRTKSEFVKKIGRKLTIFKRNHKKPFLDLPWDKVHEKNSDTRR